MEPTITVADFWFGAFDHEWDRNCMPKADDRIRLWFNSTRQFTEALRERFEKDCSTPDKTKSSLD